LRVMSCMAEVHEVPGTTVEQYVDDSLHTLLEKSFNFVWPRK